MRKFAESEEKEPFELGIAHLQQLEEAAAAGDPKREKKPIEIKTQYFTLDQFTEIVKEFYS